MVRGRSNRYLRHVNKLGENLSSQLSGWPAEHHQLNPLGDTITQGYGTLHRGDVLHAAVADVVLIVPKLAKSTKSRALMLYGNCEAFPIGGETPNSF